MKKEIKKSNSQVLDPVLNNYAKILKENNITPYGLHKLTGISLPTVFRLNSKIPRLDIALKISKALNVSVNDIWSV